MCVDRSRDFGLFVGSFSDLVAGKVSRMIDLLDPLRFNRRSSPIDSR